MKSKQFYMALCMLGFALCTLLMSGCKAKEQESLVAAVTPATIEMLLPEAQRNLLYVDETEVEVLPLLVGEEVQLSYTLHPEDVSCRDVLWSSSQPNVVSVSAEGKIKALQEAGLGYSIIGVAPLGVYAGSNIFSNLKVKVSRYITYATEVKIAQPESTEFYVGEGLQLRATIAPDEATYRTLEWKSADEAIATVDQKGYVLGVNTRAGEVTSKTTIYAIARDGSKVSDQVEVTVMKAVDPESVTLAETFDKAHYVCAIAEKQITLDYTLTPASATRSKVVWESSNPEIATVEGGVVTLNQSGNFGDFTITATCPNGQSASMEMTVAAGKIRELYHNEKNITWKDAGQSGNNSSTSTEWHDGYITITTYNQNATNQRADFKCAEKKVWIDPKAYPIFAVRMEDVKDKYAEITSRNINMDCVGTCVATGEAYKGSVGGGNNKYTDYKLSDGTHVFIYNFTELAFATGGLLPNLGEFTTFQLKYADMKTIDHQINYNVYWVQTFRSLEELREYIAGEGLTIE